jgi:hypothetical protein
MTAAELLIFSLTSRQQLSITYFEHDYSTELELDKNNPLLSFLQITNLNFFLHKVGRDFNEL